MSDTGIDPRVVSMLCFAGAWVVGTPILVLHRDTVRFANQSLVRALGYAGADELIGLDAGNVVRGLTGASSPLRAVEDASAQPPHGIVAKLLPKRGGSRQEAAYVASIAVGGDGLTMLLFHSLLVADVSSAAGSAPDVGALAPALGRAILEAVPSPILIQDFDTILFANAAARAYLQATERTQIEGQPIASIVHPDGMDAMVERVRFVFETQHRLRDVPVKVRTHDGRSFHTVADAYPVNAEGVLAALIVATSVSEGRPD